MKTSGIESRFHIAIKQSLLHEIMNKEMGSAFKINFKEFRAILYTTRFNKLMDMIDELDMKRLINIYQKLKK